MVSTTTISVGQSLSPKSFQDVPLPSFTSIYFNGHLVVPCYQQHIIKGWTWFRFKSHGRLHAICRAIWADGNCPPKHSWPRGPGERFRPCQRQYCVQQLGQQQHCPQGDHHQHLPVLLQFGGLVPSLLDLVHVKASIGTLSIYPLVHPYKTQSRNGSVSWDPDFQGAFTSQALLNSEFAATNLTGAAGSVR